MARPRLISPENLERAIKATLACGLPVREVLLTADGARVVIGTVDHKEHKAKSPGPERWTDDD